VRIYFIRHAIAQNAEEFQGEDQERPLTKEGIKKAKKAFHGLARIMDRPDVIISSTSMRARETAALLGKCFKNTNIIETDRLLPGASYLDFLKVMEEIPHEGGSAVIVGHEPDISLILSALLAGNPETDPLASPIRMNIKKSACVVVELLGVHGTLLEFLSPRTLRLLAGK